MNYHLDLISELMKKFGAAGFNSCGKDLRTIVEDINGIYPQKGNNLRMLYLMYEGLANAKIHIPEGEFDMAGENSGVRSEIKFEKDICGPYEVNGDRRYFDFKINIKKMHLHKCVDYLPKSPEGSIYDSLKNLRNKKFQRVGSVWHAQWLYKHQEFVPDTWKDIIWNDGYIIFPGARLVTEGYPETRDLDIRYPMLRKPRGYTGIMELDFLREGDLCISKVNHFIATVGPNFEKVFLSKKPGPMKKTRRYH